VGVLLNLLGFLSCGGDSTPFFRDQLLYGDTVTILPGRIRALDWQFDRGDELHINMISSSPLTNVALIQGDAAWADYLQHQVIKPYQSFAAKDALTVSWVVSLDKRDYYYLLLENNGKETINVTVRIRY